MRAADQARTDFALIGPLGTMSFLLRLILTLLFSPLYLIFPEAAVIFWIGYEDEVEARRGRKAEARQAEIDRKNWERREEEIAQNAEWMRAHPVEAARIERERQRRLEIEKMEHRAKMAAEAKERHEAQMAFEAAEEKRRNEERIALEADG